MKIKKIYARILDILFPLGEFCISCQKRGEYNSPYLCENCIMDLEYIETPCVFCAYPVEIRDKKICLDCLKSIKKSEFEVFSSYLLNERTEKIIYNYKYYYKKYLSHSLAELAYRDLEKRDIIKDIDYIVPVPSGRKRILKRAFDHTELIAKIISKKLNIPYANLLKRDVHLLKQVGLERSQRFEQIKGVFNFCNILNISKNQPIKVLTVDDIFTSGATMNEAQRTLRKNGIDSIAYTIFRSKRKHSVSK